LEMGVLLFSNLGLAHVREEAGVGRAAMGKVGARFVQAEGAIHGEANIRCIFILLAIVFPPADRAQRERAGGFQRLVTAARTTKTNLHQCFHMRWTGKRVRKFTRGRRPGPPRLPNSLYGTGRAAFLPECIQ